MPGCFFEVPPLTLCRWRSLRTRKFAMMCDAFRSVIPNINRYHDQVHMHKPA